MATNLDGLRVVALVDTDFEQVELTEPMQALRDAGATVQIVSAQQVTPQGRLRAVERPQAAAGIGSRPERS